MITNENINEFINYALLFYRTLLIIDGIILFLCTKFTVSIDSLIKTELFSCKNIKLILANYTDDDKIKFITQPEMIRCFITGSKFNTSSLEYLLELYAYYALNNSLRYIWLNACIK
jgi:hypothetical protein